MVKANWSLVLLPMVWAIAPVFLCLKLVDMIWGIEILDRLITKANARSIYLSLGLYGLTFLVLAPIWGILAILSGLLGICYSLLCLIWSLDWNSYFGWGIVQFNRVKAKVL